MDTLFKMLFQLKFVSFSIFLGTNTIDAKRYVFYAKLLNDLVGRDDSFHLAGMRVLLTRKTPTNTKKERDPTSVCVLLCPTASIPSW